MNIGKRIKEERQKRKWTQETTWGEVECLSFGSI